MTMTDHVDAPPGGRSPESFRREVDREIVGLLRQNQQDNRQILALLAEVVGRLTQLTSQADIPPATRCSDTGLWDALLEED
jgi:hypothetical protein